MQAKAAGLLGTLGHVTGEVMVQGIEAAGDPEALSLLVRNGCVLGGSRSFVPSNFFPDAT
jgi:hypothetical protein